MNEQRPPLFLPALIGGAIAGVLSCIPFLNCLCCLWILGGAMLAAFLWSKDTPIALTPGDGALVGAFTGLFAAAVHSLISIPLAAANLAFFKRIFDRLSVYTNEMPPSWQQWLDQSAGPFTLPGFFLGLIISAAMFAILGALGGILGLALFGKKNRPAGVPGQIPPPPPPPGPQA